MKRIVTFIIASLLTVLSINVFGQISSSGGSPPLRERIFFSGNMGLQFGTYTNIQIAPAIGLWLLPRLAVAVGPKYLFYKDPIGKTDIYGGRAYSQFMVIQDINNLIPLGMSAGIYLHTEYECLSLQKNFWQDYTYNGRFTVHSALAGFGFSQPVGPRSAMTLTILWTLNDTGYELYDNPEIRIGFVF